MNALSVFLNEVSAGWWNYVWHGFWQSGLVGVLLLSAVYFGRRWPAPWRYGLLLVALAKFAVPPVLPISAGLFGVAGPIVAHATPFGADFAIADTTPPIIMIPSRAVVDLETGNRDLVSLAPAGARNPNRVPLRWQAWCMLAHSFGTVCVIGWIGGQYVRLRRCRLRARPAGTGDLVDDLIVIARQIGLRRKPRLVISDDVPMPVAFGVLDPTVMLPARSLERLPRGELRIILAHELAHFRRRDLWVNLIQIVLFAAWWFHPVLWVLNRKLRNVREDCCDDLVLARDLASADAYTSTLLHAVAEHAVRVRVSTTLVFAESLHPLGPRLARLMDRSIRRSDKLSFAGLTALVLLAVLLLPGLRSQDAASEAGRSLSSLSSDSTNSARPSISGGSGSRESFEKLFSRLRRLKGRIADYPPSFIQAGQRAVDELGPTSVPFLIEKLQEKTGEGDEDRSVETRRKAAWALGKLGAAAKPAVPALIAALEDEAAGEWGTNGARLFRDIRERVCSIAATALGDLGQTAKSAEAALFESLNYGVGSALVALVEIDPGSPKVFATLKEALNDHTKGQNYYPETPYRLAALKALETLSEHNPAAMAVIASVSAEGDPTLSAEVEKFLPTRSKDSGGGGRLVDETLDTSDAAKRANGAAMSALTGGRSPAVLAALLAGMKDASVSNKRFVIEGLTTFRAEAKEAIPDVVREVKSGNPRVRRVALRALEIILDLDDHDNALGKLAGGMLLDRDEQVRGKFTDLLAEMRPGPGLTGQQTLKLLHDPNPRLRAGAVTALGAIPTNSRESLPLLESALGDKSLEVRQEALMAIGHFGEGAQRFVPMMIKELKSADGSCAAIALGNLGKWAAPAVSELIKSLENKADDSTFDGLANNSALALGRIGKAAKQAIPALTEALNHPDANVRHNAAFSLWQIDGRTNIIPILADRLSSDANFGRLDWLNAKSVRLSDINRLAEIGSAAQSATPVLLKMLKGEDEDLREAARDALEKIQMPNQPQAWF